jgi:hypothetical protein
MYDKIKEEIKQNYYQQNFPNDGQRFVAWYRAQISHPAYVSKIARRLRRKGLLSSTIKTRCMLVLLRRLQDEY